VKNRQELEAAGVRVISSSLKGRAVDLPAISAEAVSPLQDTSWQVVLDVGGDLMGARVLSGMRNTFTLVSMTCSLLSMPIVLKPWPHSQEC
jgi:hypothetical protein